MSIFDIVSAWFSNKNLPISSERLEESSLSRLSEITKVTISRADLFEQALSHRSFLRVNKLSPHKSYERLEFLGDGLVNMIVAEHLFKRFPKEDEGFLTKLRARLVNGSNLALLCRSTGLSDLILFGPDVGESTVRENLGIQADVFESICGALYLQSGFQEVKKFVLASIEAYVDVEELSVTSENYKSELLELLQSHGKKQPTYNVVRETGPAHKKNFEIEVCVDSLAIGKGLGRSKKIAEQKAAKVALEQLEKDESLSSNTHH